ncbi:DUF502 domain-containing protein [Halorubrum rubrum]|uniref:DUF502 domain-containing protein n=1 Tax=Halorubrum rubrum TaxID=1126240 RepID=A0ABD5R4J8_9EURY|nr:DUF502 domain-containing protein [Halorubrum rubrum]
MSTWKRDFASGLIVLAPLLVLLLVIRWIYLHIASIPLIDALQPNWIPAPLEPVSRVVIAIAVLSTLVLAVGYFMRTTLGRIAEAKIDDTINRIPALRVVYNASKLAAETAISGTEELQNPVYIETWAGIRMTAFRTGKKTRDGKIVLFMPTAPNITTGFVIEVSPDRVEDTGESVEEGMTRILSAGFGESAHQIPVEEERPPADDRPEDHRPGVAHPGRAAEATSDASGEESNTGGASGGREDQSTDGSR